jgi:hypothetical protein
MNNKHIIKTVLVNLVLAIICDTAAFADSVKGIQILKISAQDERAVIKTHDGKTLIIKPGDPLGTNGKVTEVAADRVVIEEKNGNETEKVIIRLIDGKQKVERLKKTGEQAPAMLSPAEKDVKDTKQGSGFR